MELDFSGSEWIRTDELVIQVIGGPSLAGPRAFRRLIPNPQGVTPVLANILIAADYSYTLYVNGNQEGTGNNPTIAHPYCVSVNSECGTLIAITAVNVDIAPKLLAKIEVTYDDGTSTNVVGSDSAWKALNNPDIPSNYTNFSFDDSSWPNAVICSRTPPLYNITLPSESNIMCKCPKPCKCTS